MAPTSALLASTKETERAILDAIEDQFHLSDDALLKITEQFLEDFHLGLGEYNHPMAMIPTFVTGVPNGSETGTFLALDLGGTNLRVCEVQLQGNHEFSMRQQKYRVSEALKTGEASALFDYLADSVDAFLTDHATSASTADPFGHGSNSIDALDSAIPLGLTFSFPVEQTALDEGKILTWTKGFSAKNAIGHDVVKLLQDAFDRKHMHVRCVALVNDTVGALLSRGYSAGDCLLGAIFGTGTNGAYLEKVENITKLGDSPARKKGGSMVVNCEWGAFNNTRTTLPTTPFDNKLDRESINPRLQAFEKFISGMYLGEITRNILLSLVDAAPRPILFNGLASRELNQHYGLDTAFLSEVEEAWEQGRVPKSTEGAGVEGAHALNTVAVGEVRADDPKPHQTDVDAFYAEDQARLERIRSIIIQRLAMDAANVTLRDAAIVRWAASLVANRAARLSGSAVSAVMVQTGNAKLGGGYVPPKGRFVIGVDGSLIEHYPNFNARLRESITSLIGEGVEKMIELGMAKDGSGVGAALGALQAVKAGQ